MVKVALVVLNYLNYGDTIDCIESVLKINYPLCGIVIVDNFSNNGSIKNIYSKYKHNNLIKIIRTNKNVGFAKGNNIGINYARINFHTDYIFVVNNDTIFLQRDFFQNMLKHYKQGVGIIGPKIMLKDRRFQKHFLVYFKWMDIILYYICLWCLWLNNDLLYENLYEKLNKRNKVEALHGCALLFTPDFFKHYNGFYPKTFLYCEEEILFWMCQHAGLEECYSEESLIYHKEDGSSQLSFKNDNSIKLKYILKSYFFIFYAKLGFIRRYK